MRHNSTRLALGLVVLALIGCDGNGGPVSKKLSGSGSTFIKPIMVKWIDVYSKENRGVEINYQGTGSTAGIKQMTDGAVDFGCTDAFMTKEQLATASQRGGEVLHIPLVMGAIVPAYNLPGVDKPLHFTGDVLADIFLGTIKKWNDPALQAINKDVPLPDLAISVVHRTEGSGSTAIFTSYLNKFPTWQKAKVGAGTAVKWPVGIGEQGNPGVAGSISHNPGSIGYLELYFALLKKGEIQFGSVRNRSGKDVAADLNSITKAAESSLKDKDRVSDDLNIDLIDAPGDESYPISGTTWAVLYTDQKPETGKALAAFLTWATHQGQEYNEGMHYAKLPAALVKRIEDKLKKIKR